MPTSLADRRDALLRAVAHTAGLLLSDASWGARVEEALRVLGQATEVDRVYVFENHLAEGALLSSQRWEWCAEGVEPQIDNPELQSLPFREAGFGRWVDELAAGRVVHGDIDDFPADEQGLLREQEIASLVVVPISVSGAWWGFIGFDATGDARGWTDPEVDALRAAAGVLGAGIGQHQVVAELHASRRSFADAYRRERDAADRLRHADQLKDRFLETVSHELRTPLTAVEGLAQTLRARAADLSPAQTDQLLDRLVANTDRLHRRMTDLIDVNRLQRAGLGLAPERVRLPALIERIVVDCAPLRHRRLTVECQVDEVTLDVSAFDRILMNLLLNAAIHTPDTAQVWIRVEAAATDRILLVVEDDGPGIPADARESVFETFEHGPGRRDHSPGTGVGLSIVRGYAEHHGGHAWVVEREGGGASFRVLFGHPGVGDRR